MQNRVAIVEVADALILAGLRDGTPRTWVVRDQLPGDAALVAVSFDGRTVYFTFRSAEFAPVPEGGPIPRLFPLFRSIEHTVP